VNRKTAMTTITLADAQARFPELIAAVGRGEEFVVTVGESPVARIGAAARRSPIDVGGPSVPEAREAGTDQDGLSATMLERLQERGFGSMRGRIWMADDFDAIPEDFAEYV
jgi:antitoxin (DNA-binding transcriptional repressor) of toxin-antitoxin stability system